MQAWPTPLAEAGTSTLGVITAHEGIAGMARELYSTLLPYIVSDGAEDRHLTFAGAPSVFVSSYNVERLFITMACIARVVTTD